jgi:drug/metabolite transporter (DMT)-like permease
MSIFLFSLLVNTAYFIADLFIKYSSTKQPTGQILFFRSLYAVALSSIFLLIELDKILIPSGLQLGILIACGFLNAFGLYAYIKALQTLHFANVSVLGIAGALIHYAVAALFQHTLLSVWFYIASFFCMAGIGIQWKKQQSNAGLIWASTGAIAWGLGYAFLSFPMQTTSASFATLLTELCLLVFALGMGIPKNISVAFKQSSSLFGVAFFTILGSWLLNISYAKFNLNLMGFMQLAFFPYSLLAGYFMFKEKLSKQEWIGISLIGIGLLLYFLKVEA